MSKTPRVQTALTDPISEIVRIAEPVGQRDAAGKAINPATEDTLAAQSDFVYGQTTISTIETQLVVISIPCRRGVLIKALSTNTGIVYVGKAGVTVASGYELTAGEVVSIEIDNVNKIFAVADAIGQKVSWIGV